MPAALLALLLAPAASASVFDGDLPTCDDAFPASDQLDTFVVTMSPGEAAFSFVGHAAAWVRLPDQMDAVINFGTFDARNQEPATALMLGTLKCFWTVRSREKEISRYERQSRSMAAQRLNLPPRLKKAFVANLQKRARGPDHPETFHWFKNNCATGIRDVLDEVLGHTLSKEWTDINPLTPRQEVLRHLAPNAAAWFAWNDQAGPWADQPITRYEAAFVPERFAEALARTNLTWPDGTRHPLASDPCLLYKGSYGPAEDEPPNRDAALWGMGLGLAALVSGLSRLPGRLARVGAGTVVGLMGLVMGVLGTGNMIFWKWSALEGFGPNENWFVSNPLSLLLVVLGVRWAWRGFEGTGPVLRWGAMVLAAMSTIGLLLNPFPFMSQVNLGVIGLFAPITWIAGYLVSRRR